MEVDRILKKYGLTRDTATQYIDATTCMNQSQAAEEIGVSRDTITRYKNKFAEMTPQERSQIIVTLTTDKMLQNSSHK